MQRLFLNGREVELKPKSIAQTYQVNDLAELKDRQLHFTQKFNIPQTPINVDVMQYLGVIGSKSRKAYEQIPAKFIYDGVELMATGWAKVSKSNAGGFDVNIYDGNASLYETLKGRRMNDLNYSDLNHALNGTTHLESMDNTSGYIYALMDSGFATVTGIVNSERQVAALYKHTLFDKILTEAGFTYSGDVFSDTEFLREVVTPTKGYDVVGEETTETSKGNASSNTISKNEYQLQDPEYEEEQFTQTDNSLIDVSVQTGDTLQFDVAGLYRVNYDIDWDLVTGECAVQARLNDSSTAGSFNMTLGQSGIESGSFYIQAEVGDQIRWYTNSHAIPGAPAKFEIEFDAQVDSAFTLVTGGLIVKFEDIMPDTSQIDFIKSIMQDYGLMFQATKNTNHYNFMEIEELVNARSDAEDWSDKLIDEGDEQYVIGGYAQSNWMLYNYNKSEEIQDTSFDGNLTANHQNIPNEKTLFTSLYTISEKTQTRNGEPIYQVPLWIEKVEQEGTVVNNLISPFRSFKLKYIDTTVTFKFGTVVGNYSRVNNMPFLSLENMSYDYYQQIYYTGFKRILDAQKKRTVPMLLKAFDIYSLDFLRLKYLKQLGQYFYLNKVRNFVDAKQTMVELIQVNELTVNQPPNQLGVFTLTINHAGSRNMPLINFVDTLPIYNDPEYDEPQTIKITSGLGGPIQWFNNGVEITDDTPFDVETMNVVIIDDGTDDAYHDEDFNFTIQSYNNPNFSSETGRIEVSVNAEQNLAPTANAGSNNSMPYDSSGGPQNEVVYPNGSNSSDPNGDTLTYLWTADALPPTVVLTNETLSICTLTGTGLTGLESGTVITMTLRVDDGEFWDEDTMIVTIIDLDNPPI